MFHGCQFPVKIHDFYYIILELTYKINKYERSINILNRLFVDKNKNRGRIIYNKHEYELVEYFEDFDNNNNDKIKLLLYLEKNINDISYLFSGCDSLLFVDYYQVNNKSAQINDDSYIVLLILMIINIVI